MSCVGYRNSPCHACLLFCTLVPAVQTPLITANLRPPGLALFKEFALYFLLNFFFAIYFFTISTFFMFAGEPVSSPLFRDTWNFQSQTKGT